jgi:hypothetical protein
MASRYPVRNLDQTRGRERGPHGRRDRGAGTGAARVAGTGAANVARTADEIVGHVVRTTRKIGD